LIAPCSIFAFVQLARICQTHLNFTAFVRECRILTVN